MNKSWLFSQRDSERRITPGRDIASRAVAKGLGERDRDVDWIKQNFSLLVEQVQADAYEDYKQAERIAGADTIAEVFIGLLGSHSAEETVSCLALTFLHWTGFS